MEKKVDVAIIGAGTAGLSAFREVTKVTKSAVIVNDGPLGTTCARVGCMPSKLLIQAADDFHRRLVLDELGLRGGDKLVADIPAVLKRVRRLRDEFVAGVLKSVKAMGDALIAGRAEFLEPGVLRVSGGKTVRAKRVIIATGSRPLVPDEWKKLGDRIITSDDIFEREDLPKKIAVVGLGIIGMELGQALARLGLVVAAAGRDKFVAGLSDPDVNESLLVAIGSEMPLWTGAEAKVEPTAKGVRLSVGKRSAEADALLAALGRVPNVDGMGLERLGVSLDKKGVPPFNPATMRVGDLPVYIAGDAGAERPLLHEAADAGRIAGYNAVRQTETCFVRRPLLAITFCDPNVAVVGMPWREITPKATAVGEVSFTDQGRSRILARNHGKLRVYANRKTGELLGAELAAPAGEHLAHLLSWALHSGATVTQMLQMPFYHPVVEEGLRTALRDCLKQVERPQEALELALCGESGVESLS